MARIGNKKDEKSCHIFLKRFQIDGESGQIISTASFLGQAGASFELLVKAQDRGGVGLAATKTLIVSNVSCAIKTLCPLYAAKGEG